MSLDIALALAAQGYAVTPLLPGTSDAFTSAWPERASSDPEVVKAKWPKGRDYNVGIVTGRLHRDTGKYLFVLDEDNKNKKRGEVALCGLELKHGELPDTRTVRSPSNGRHRYFLSPTPIGNSNSKIGEGLDIKGWHGQVAAPGSVKQNGPYVVELDVPIADAPEWLVQLCGAPRERSADSQTPLVELDQPDAIERAIDYLKNRAPNHGTYVVAAQVKDYGIGEDKNFELVLAHWESAEAKDPDYLSFRVGNGYRYGQNQPGIKHPSVELPPVILPIRAPLPIRNVAAFTWNTAQDYLVRGLLNRGMLALMSGQSNAGKSPLALDLASAIAKGEPWRGRKVKPGYVLHISTEGWTGLENRMEALRRTHFEGREESPLDFVAMSINLRTSIKDVEAIEQTVIDRAAHFGVAPAMVVIDTLSHALGGGDESNAEHVRTVLRNCKRITAKTGAAVLLLHHPTKDASSDYRGSSILLNDIDLLIKVDADARSKLTRVTTPRVKDYGEIDPLAFRIKVLELGADPEGDTITSVVVEWVEKAEMDFEAKLTPPQAEALQALENITVLAEPKQTKATHGAWKEALKSLRSDRSKISGEDQALSRATPVLIQNGLVAKLQSGEYVRTAIA